MSKKNKKKNLNKQLNKILKKMNQRRERALKKFNSDVANMKFSGPMENFNVFTDYLKKIAEAMTVPIEADADDDVLKKIDNLKKDGNINPELEKVLVNILNELQKIKEGSDDES